MYVATHLVIKISKGQIVKGLISKLDADTDSKNSYVNCGNNNSIVHI